MGEKEKKGEGFGHAIGGGMKVFVGYGDRVTAGEMLHGSATLHGRAGLGKLLTRNKVCMAPQCLIFRQQKRAYR